jgi:hypothetical protein
MPIYKVPNPNVSAIACHGEEFDVENGFIEVPDEIITPEIEYAITTHAGCVLATQDDVDEVVTLIDTGKDLKRNAEERARLLKILKDAGIKIDGRKSLEWVQERFDEMVAQGLVTPDGGAVQPAPAPVEPPVEPGPTDEPPTPAPDVEHPSEDPPPPPPEEPPAP